MSRSAKDRYAKLCAVPLILILSACSGEDEGGDETASGGQNATGGQSATGGAGASPASGGSEPGAASGGSTSGAGEPEVMKGMTAAHNAVRLAADPSMPELVWDAEVAAVAQAHADALRDDDCAFHHSSSPYGENIYWASGFAIAPSDVVDSWASEEADYDYDSNSCSAVCGHYTQIVWAKSLRLGCGTSICSDNSEIWVCNYDPPGNFNGQPPY